MLVVILNPNYTFARIAKVILNARVVFLVNEPRAIAVASLLDSPSLRRQDHSVDKSKRVDNFTLVLRVMLHDVKQRRGCHYFLLSDVAHGAFPSSPQFVRDGPLRSCVVCWCRPLCPRSRSHTNENPLPFVVCPQ